MLLKAGLLATRIEQIEGSLQGILAQLDDLTEEEPVLPGEYPDREQEEMETETLAAASTAPGDQ